MNLFDMTCVILSGFVRTQCTSRRRENAPRSFSNVIRSKA
jgi:hypothetical protein